MQALVEDFLQYLRHERGQAEHTQRTYAGLLNKFLSWAQGEKLTDWKQVELRHLMSFLEHERERTLAHEPQESTRRLSSESSTSKSPRFGPSTASRRTRNTCPRTSPSISPSPAVGSACRNH
ncbi:MAG: site-specific integrase [Verrucomicrobiota bacterium]